MARSRIPKVYGQSMVSSCPFCGKVATAKSEQGADVCSKHTKTQIVNAKCNCGDYIDLLSGRYGPYFNCLKCGNINYQKGLDMWRASGCASEEINNDQRGFRDEFKAKWGAKKSIKRQRKMSAPAKKKEIVISSRDSFWFD
tara:strand:+ start:2303 stop:2725 length:423 start_codon:yes stop_codon:yes gene_type:complete